MRNVKRMTGGAMVACVLAVAGTGVALADEGVRDVRVETHRFGDEKAQVKAETERGTFEIYIEGGEVVKALVDGKEVDADRVKVGDAGVVVLDNAGEVMVEMPTGVAIAGGSSDEMPRRYARFVSEADDLEDGGFRFYTVRRMEDIEDRIERGMGVIERELERLDLLTDRVEDRLAEVEDVLIEEADRLSAELMREFDGGVVELRRELSGVNDRMRELLVEIDIDDLMARIEAELPDEVMERLPESVREELADVRGRVEGLRLQRAVPDLVQPFDAQRERQGVDEDPDRAIVGVQIRGVEAPSGFDGAVSVEQTMAGLPAAAAGVLPGDVIVAVDGEEFSGLEGFRELIVSRDAGERVRLTIVRGENRLELNLRTVSARSLQSRAQAESGMAAEVELRERLAAERAETALQLMREREEVARAFAGERERVRDRRAAQGSAARLDELEARMERIEALLERLVEGERE